MLPSPVLDTHSHFLPNLDDGARSLEESIEIIQTLLSFGIESFITTPHYYPGRYVPSQADIEKSLLLVKNELIRKNLAAEIQIGRECYLDVELMTNPNRKALSFHWNQKLYQLIELPYMAVEGAALEYGYQLLAEGITPILAHVERYRTIMNDPLSVEPYRAAGFLIQVDVRSFLPQAQSKMQSAAFTLLKKNKIDVIATDVHHSSQLEGIRKAIKILQDTVGESWKDYFSLDFITQT